MIKQSSFGKHRKKFTFRNKPLHSYILSVILTICLVFGTGVDLSFASEFLPEGPQDVYISQLESQTLYASKNSKNVSSYQWQIYAPEVDEYIPINGEIASSLKVDAALVKNVLDSQDIAKIKCVSFDSNDTEIASKYYIVHFDSAKDNVNQQIVGSAVNTKFSDLTGKTVSVNNEVENEADLEITVSYYTTQGQELGISNTLKFDRATTFDWSIQIINLNGAILSSDKPFYYDNKAALDSAGFAVVVTDLVETNDGLYIKHDQSFGAIPDSFSNIKICVYLEMDDITYAVNASYQKKDNDAEYETFPPEDRTAPLGIAVPTIKSEGSYVSDIDYFTTEFNKADPTGWEAVNFQQHNLTIQDKEEKLSIDLIMNRTYTICFFDPNGGVNGPAAIYMKHGDSFQNVLAWQTDESGKKVPTPEPTREAYSFAGWTLDGETTIAEWADVPGDDTTYHAKWELNLAKDYIPVTIAYYCEKADSPDYEYMIERYDRVPANTFVEGKTTYTLPADKDSDDPYLDRRFPQQRASSSDEYTLKEPSVIEHVEGTPTNLEYNSCTYDTLFEYDSSDTPLVYANGSTICKVKLKRKTFTYTFYSGNSWSSDIVSGGVIKAKWDQNIFEQYKKICRTKTSNSYDSYSWYCDSTDYQIGVITHMGFQDDRYCDDGSFGTGAYTVYYTQKVGADWTIDSNPSLEIFKHNNKSYSWDPPTDIYDKIIEAPVDKGTLLGGRVKTTEDEFINMYGFIRPTWLGETISGDNYYGGPQLGTKFYNKPFLGSVKWNGLRYIYKRNKNSLYLRNIHGAESKYHYDNCCVVADRNMSKNKATEGGVQYQYPIKDFNFQITEKTETSSGVIGDIGVTGIAEGNSFMSYIPTVPEDIDQNYVFAGWYEDEAYENQVTSYDYKTGTHSVVDDWTMPNHQQDLYAKWIAPERKVEFYTENPSTGQLINYTEANLGKPATVDYGSLINNDEYKVFPKTEDEKLSHNGWRFVSWFYYASAADRQATKRTYFDPENMTMPWCDYGRLPSSGDSAYTEPILQMYEYWVPDSQVYYQVDYKIKGATAAEDIVVADSTIGKGRVDSDVTVYAKDPVNNPDSFLYKYRGILKYDPNDEQEKTIHLDAESSNKATFYYALNDDAQYQYRIYIVLKDFYDNDKIAYIRKSGTEDNPTLYTWDNYAWATSPDLLASDIPSDWDTDLSHYKLQSPQDQTINLSIHNPDWAKYENCILVEYMCIGGENPYKTFNYDAITVDSSSQPRTDLAGGSIIGGASHQVLPFQALEYGTCMPCLGFKFVKWQIEKETDVWDDIPETAYTFNDDGSVVLICPTDVSGTFETDRHYRAVFKEDDDVTISYNAITLNGDEIASYQCGNIIRDGSTTTFHPVYSSDPPTIQTAKPFVFNVNSFDFMYWAIKKADGTYEKISDATIDQTFSAPFIEAKDANNNDYKYYISENYYALFKENPIEISYKVLDNTKGSVSLIQDSSINEEQTVTETVMPHAASIQGAKALAKTYYKFVKWSKNPDGTEVASTNSEYIPSKTAHSPSEGGDYYESGTYYANFDEITYIVNFDCGDHGSIDEQNADVGPYTVSENAVVNVPNDKKSASIKCNHKGVDVTIVATADDGYMIDYWSYRIGDVGEEFIGDYTITSDVTIKVFFKEIPKLDFIFEVHYTGEEDSAVYDPGKIKIDAGTPLVTQTIKIPVENASDYPTVKYNISNDSLEVNAQKITNFIAKAMPDENCSFLYWARSDIKGFTETAIFTDEQPVEIDTSHYFYAYFSKNHQVKVDKVGQGTVSPTNPINSVFDTASLKYTVLENANIPTISLIYNEIPIIDPITASPAEHWRFTRWTYIDSASTVTTPQDFPDGGIQITRDVGDITLYANFVINSVTVSFASDGNGSVNPGNQLTVNETSQITIDGSNPNKLSIPNPVGGSFTETATATNSSQYKFLKWTVKGSGDEIDLSTGFVIKENITIKAYFELIDYTVTFTDDENGVVDPGGTLNAFYGTEVTLDPETFGLSIDALEENIEVMNIPVANEGMEFDKWTVITEDDEFDFEPDYTITENVIFKANFKAIPPVPGPDPEQEGEIANVQTGDSVLPYALCGIALAAIAFFVFRRRRNNA